MKTALLLSGGMDSTALAFLYKPEMAITIDYGQRAAAAEIRAAAAACAELKIQQYVIKCDLSALGSGDMAGRAALEAAPVSEWWPFRNQMLITLGAMHGIALRIQRLLIGILKTDRRHADGTAEFVDLMNALLGHQEGGMSLEAPAIQWTAVELIRAARVPMEILAWAHSCHVANEACGSCGGCRKHYEILAELGLGPY